MYWTCIRAYCFLRRTRLLVWIGAFLWYDCFLRRVEQYRLEYYIILMSIASRDLSDKELPLLKLSGGQETLSPPH